MAISDAHSQAPAGGNSPPCARDKTAIRRTAPYNDEPGYYEPAKLWLYGNVKLLQGQLACVRSACGPQTATADQLDEIEAEAERLVLSGKVLVCGVHGIAHQRAAVVPLRWGSPRIVVMSGGFRYHLGDDLKQEPFRIARLWRYEWDALTDLAVSRRAPCKLPTFSSHNRTVDKLIALLVTGRWPGLRSVTDSLTPILTRPA
jgi:hypothetical protein